MGAGRALSRNAHRRRELAELLLQGPRTMAELADALGVSANDVEHILGRLRKNGLPVAIVEGCDAEARYRIPYPKGRVCAAKGCGTLLRRSNPSDHCELHGGGVLDVSTEPQAIRRRGRRPTVEDIDWRSLRELFGLSLREWSRRAGLSPGFVSRIERGERRPSPEVVPRPPQALPCETVRRPRCRLSLP